MVHPVRVLRRMVNSLDYNIHAFMVVGTLGVVMLVLCWNKICLEVKLTFTEEATAWLTDAPLLPMEENLTRSELYLAHFRRSLSTWPNSKPKGLIYYLIQANELRLKYLTESLKRLDKYFNKKFEYPVIIFHEADVDFNMQQRIQAGVFSSRIYFQQIQLSIPSFLKSKVPKKTVCSDHSVGYRHMCRFQAKLVYEQPILRGLKYLWRLDDDSLITGPIEYDVFKFMDQRQLLYGYNRLTRDHARCVYGLWPAVTEYIRGHNFRPQFFNIWPKNQMYYNNFEISSLKIWKSKEYSDFIQYLDKLGGIYYYRWGDAPIKSIAVSLFVPENKVHRFTGIPYIHQ